MRREDVILCGTSELPCPRSFHASVTVDTSLFIHGGIDNSKHVLSDLYKFDIELSQWTLIKAKAFNDSHKMPSDIKVKCFCDVPCLSHHCALNYKDRYIILIGGWNGRKRCADVFAYSICESIWYQLEVCGEVPVGLSSHTGTLMSEHEVLIIGREGGVHTQRRAGDAFVLNIRTGTYRTWTYSVESRTGHTANLIEFCKEKQFRLLVYGGRKTGQQYSFVGSWSHKFEKNNDINPEQVRNIKSLVEKCPKVDIPEGRKNSRSILVNNSVVLVYGGELWRARDCITCEMFVFDCANMSWHKLPVDRKIPKLFGFSMNIAKDGKCYIFGGTEGKQCNNCLWNLHAA